MSMSEAIEKEKIEETAQEAADTTETVEEVIERPYALRGLKDGDLFRILQILKKIGIKDCKEAFLQVASGEKTAKQLGILASLDLADILIGNITKVEDDLYNLYADLSGIPAEEIKNMEFGTLPLMIYDSFSEVRNTSFFKVLSKLL